LIEREDSDRPDWLTGDDPWPTERGDRKRDHSLRPELSTADDPLPLPTATDRQKLESLARRMIAGNAMRRYREDGEDGRVSYSRRTNWYAEHPSRFYWPKCFTHAYITAAVAQMENAGMIIHDQKKPGNRHWQSWFRATEDLMNFKTELQYKPVHKIILRDENKVDIAYNDKSRFILKMIRNLDEVNAYLAKQTITLSGKTLREGDPLYVGLHCVSGATRIRLRRIFSNRSFYQNGRYQNDVQNIPRQERLWMTINGHYVAEHDYSAFYPGLLYALVGVPCDGDPYTIPDVPRQISKPILNIVVNAKNETKALRAAAQDLWKRRVGVSQRERYAMARKIIAALKEKNEPIADYFHSNVGIHLMSHESRLLEYNMRDLMRLQISFLPLHDALLVPEHKLPVLKAIMDDNLALYRESLTAVAQRLRNRGADLDNDLPAISEP
jgi:hypothetical protein